MVLYTIFTFIYNFNLHIVLINLILNTIKKRERIKIFKRYMIQIWGNLIVGTYLGGISYNA
jgi:hypothetical protein